MEDSILTSMAFRFADAVRTSARDMLDREPVLEVEDLREGSFFPRHRLVVMLHFTGAAQGDFVLSLSEETALDLMGIPSNVRQGLSNHLVGTECAGILKELLNAASGTAILGLEEHFGRLTMHPPILIHGEIDPPGVPSSTVELRLESGTLECIFVLDLADNEQERIIRQGMDDLRRARTETRLCRHLLADLLWHTRSDLPESLRLQAETALEGFESTSDSAVVSAT
jgi:CheY-specific phosphatase CheX